MRRIDIKKLGEVYLKTKQTNNMADNRGEMGRWDIL